MRLATVTVGGTRGCDSGPALRPLISQLADSVNAIPNSIPRDRPREMRTQRGFDHAEDPPAGGSGCEAGSGGGLELEHGRTSTISPSLVPHLQ
jgi:hypothetical protein